MLFGKTKLGKFGETISEKVLETVFLGSKTGKNSDFLRSQFASDSVRRTTGRKSRPVITAARRKTGRGDSLKRRQMTQGRRVRRRRNAGAAQAVWRLYRLKRRLKPSGATRGKADPAKDGYYSKNNKEKTRNFPRTAAATEAG